MTEEEIENAEAWCPHCMKKELLRLRGRNEVLDREMAEMTAESKKSDSGCESSEVNTLESESESEKEKLDEHQEEWVVVKKQKQKKVNGLNEQKSVGKKEMKEREEQKKKHVDEKPPIVMVGDSMLKGMTKYVKLTGPVSECKSMSGAGINEIVQKARRKVESIEKGMLVIEGGGNSLNALGVEGTVNAIMKGVKGINEMKKSVRLAVVGVMKRPRESKKYESMRMEVNQRVQVAMMKLKLEQWNDRENMGVSFIDPDHVLSEGHYSIDGVHLNEEGDRRLSQRLIQWFVCSTRMMSKENV